MSADNCKHIYWRRGCPQCEKQAEAVAAERELAPAACSPAPDLKQLLFDYVHAARLWHRSMDLKLSERTKRQRGDRAEAAFKKLTEAFELVQGNR